jgi:hypothetical protein
MSRVHPRKERNRNEKQDRATETLCSDQGRKQGAIQKRHCPVPDRNLSATGPVANRNRVSKRALSRSARSLSLSQSHTQRYTHEGRSSRCSRLCHFGSCQPGCPSCHHPYSKQGQLQRTMHLLTEFVLPQKKKKMQ